MIIDRIESNYKLKLRHDTNQTLFDCKYGTSKQDENKTRNDYCTTGHLQH